ncbi:MAG: DNA primase [Flavobacteriales bacterium]|jgi:DNA primase
MNPARAQTTDRRDVEDVNPYAEQLVIPIKLQKPLRTYQQYLNFIETVTFYHQYQRKQKVDKNGKKYIETTRYI